MTRGMTRKERLQLRGGPALLSQQNDKTPRVSLAVGQCVIFSNTNDLACPLCRANVPAGVLHRCSVRRGP